MIIVSLHTWLILILVSMVTAKPQLQMSYPQMSAMVVNPQPSIVVAPPQPVPVGVPIAVPIAVPFGIRIDDEETTTTTKKPQRVLKILVPWPPFEFKIPAFKPVHNISASNCTVKMPFHLGAPGFPMPFPMPIPGPPPIIMVPSPPFHRIRSSSSKSDNSKTSDPSSSSSSYTSSDDSNSDSSDSVRRKRKRKKRRYGILRSNRRFNSGSSRDEELKPMLSYLARNGDIKISKRLSKKDAALLINDEKKPRQVQQVQVVVGNDSNEKSRIKVIAGPAKSTNNHKKENKKIVLRRSSQQLMSGNKELVFRPPGNKKISNFSMSFNVAK